MKTLVNVLIIVTGLLLTIKNAALAEIELSFRFNDAGQEEMRAALDKFEQMNPGIKVELQRIAWGSAREQFLREAAVGEGPDVVHIAQVWTRSMGDAGALYDMNELIEEHGIGEGWGDFISADLASQDDGTIHAIPWTVDTFAMVYRKDILEKAELQNFRLPGKTFMRLACRLRKRQGQWAGQFHQVVGQPTLSGFS